MNPSSPSSTTIHRLNRRNFIEYGSICIASSLIAACTNNNQPSINSSQLDKVKFGTNWIAEAEHGGFYQAMSTTGLRLRHWYLQRLQFRCHHQNGWSSGWQWYSIVDGGVR